MQTNLKKHISLSHDYKHRCPECKRVFPGLNHLKIHRRTHLSIKNFVCDTCGKAFRQRHHLIDHKHTHNNVYQYKCGHCIKTFKFRQALKRHVKTCHDASFVKPYQCDDCDYTATERQHMIIHRRKHTGERPYHCEICAKQYIQVVMGRGRVPCHYSCCCCLPTPLTLASGGSRIIPLLVHQPASPSIWPAVPSLQRGLSTNPWVTMSCVCHYS